MGLKRIETLWSCPCHGPVAHTVKIAGVTWCGLCVRAKFRALGIESITTDIIRTRTDDETVKCWVCGGDRLDDDRPCGECGGAARYKGDAYGHR